MNTTHNNIFMMLFCIASAVCLYHSLSFYVWQWRNPKANEMTFYTHYVDVVTWKKLPEFQ